MIFKPKEEKGKKMFKLSTGWIIESLLDIDFYKFTMGQVIFNKHAAVIVKFRFTCRTKGAELTKVIPIEELRAQLDHVQTLSMNNSELHYLRGTNEYQERMFSEDYLQFLKNLRLSGYSLSYEGDDIILEFYGKWTAVTYWETAALSIINELYYRFQLAKMSPFEQDAVFATGVTRLMENVKELREYPELTFTEFGTRRRFSRDWQKYVTEVMANELPNQMKGTSNTKLAMELGLMPTGTAAHEMDMGYSGIYHETEDIIRGSHQKFLNDWWEQYGWGLSIALTDTYGTDFFFRDFTIEMAKKSKGFRHDSGNPIAFGEKVIKFYQDLRINPKEKMIIFSDGLDVPTMIKIFLHFSGHIIVTFGWGTNLTNDLGLKALSLVVKLVESNGHGTVKLSDNLAKAIGKPEDIEMFKRIFGHTTKFTEECKY